MAKGGSRSHSGRKRKPTDMKLVQGTFRPTRHRDETVIAAKWPEPPAHLNPRERELWDGLKEHCSTWMAPSDWMALNGTVSIMDRVLRVQEAMRETETSGNPTSFKFTPSADGEPNMEPKENHLFTLELKLLTALRGYLAIVGLSPADWARIQRPSGEAKPVNPL